MEATLLSQFFLPASLFVVMFGMGLSLTVEDFRRVSESHLSIAIGVLAQMVILPLLGLLVITALNLPGELAAGLFILSLCPGGVTSNLFCFLARGNVALSISMTAIVSVVSPFTIPLFATPFIRTYLEQGRTDLSLPVTETIATLIVMTLVPVVAGMFVRFKKPAAAARAERAVRNLSVVLLGLIVAGIVKQNWQNIPGYFVLVGESILLLNVGALLLGFLLAKVTRRPQRDCIAIGIEVGIQNGTTALFLTSTLLGSPTMSVAPALYSVVMFATGGLYAWFWHQRGTVKATEPDHHHQAA